MINYWPLKYENADMRRRTVDSLRALRLANPGTSPPWTGVSPN